MMTLGLLGIAILVLATGWFVPLPPGRRLLAIALRLGALACVVMAWRGASILHRDQRPRHIVYLVDQSESIDPEQTAWMARRVASLEAVRPRAMSRTVLSFGSQTREATSAERQPLLTPESLEQRLAKSPVDGDRTDLEAALLGALAAMPAQDRSRVILLSDGRQTAGNVERMLPHLRRLGLEVYPVPVEATQLAAVVWDQLVIPPSVSRGQPIPISLAVTNGTQTAQPVTVTVSVDDVTLSRRRVAVRPGSRVLTLSVPSFETGTMALRVQVAIGNQPPEERAAYVEVQGPPRVLVVLERPTELPPVAAALKRRQIEVAVATPSELPTDPAALLDYNAVLMVKVPKSAITEEQSAALRRYVEHYGGGLLMVGLGGALHEEIATPAPIDELLPVRFEPKGVQEADRRVCILMLIDRSASMYGPRLAATKRAAIELIKQLQPDDLVGVLAFDTMPYVLVEVQPARQAGQTVVDKLVRLKATGGTNIFPSLKAAQVRLEATGATVKHIVLLSDGNTPVDLDAYRALLNDFSEKQISISTIGIGSIAINTDLLEWLAAKTGGTMYMLRGLDELPSLVARDARQALGRLPFTEGFFQPQSAPAGTWLAPIREWPPVKGFLTTTPKPGATVELTVPSSKPQDGASTPSTLPLLAQWPVGLGRVAVFTSDADARWSPDWVRWPEFETVWSEVLRRTMRPQPDQELFTWVGDQLGAPELIVEGALADPAAELVAADGQSMGSLALVQHGATRWAAPVGHVPDGWYRLIVRAGADRSDAAAASPLFASRWVFIGSQQPEGERRHVPPDRALLGRIASQTRGLLDAPDRAFLPPTEWVQRRQPLRDWLLPLAMLLLLLDVAVRGRTLF